MKKCDLFVIRFFDILLSFVTLLALSPILLVICAALKATGEGEVFYRQSRVGLGGNNFYLIKFATMLKNSPALTTGTITLKDDPRILRFGKLLRATKINEIPQLINVIKGEMSLIGPRPLTPELFKAYNHEAMSKIQKMKPGLSGVGSIVFHAEEKFLQKSPKNSTLFYNEIIMPYKGLLECWYFENFSLKLYSQLILMTLLTIFFGSSDEMFSKYPSLPTPPKKLRQ